MNDISTVIQRVLEQADNKGARGDVEALFMSVMGDYIKQTSLVDYKAMFEGYARELTKQAVLDEAETYLMEHRERVGGYACYSEMTPWDSLMNVVDELKTRLATAQRANEILVADDYSGELAKALATGKASLNCQQAKHDEEIEWKEQVISELLEEIEQHKAQIDSLMAA